MTLEFTSLAELLEPGKHRRVGNHFGVDPTIADRMDHLANHLTVEVNQMLTHFYETGNQDGLDECHLLKKIFALIDEHVQPQKMADVAFSVFTASHLLAFLNPFILRALDNHRTIAQPTPTHSIGSLFKSNTTATA